MASDDVVRAHVISQCLVGKDEPVAEHVRGHAAHVLRKYVLAPAHEGERLSGHHHINRRPRAYAERDVAGQILQAR